MTYQTFWSSNIFFGRHMEITKTYKEKLIVLAKHYGAKKLILFGSAVDSFENARDIDLACDGIEGWKLYEFAAKAEEELNINVDIISLSSSPIFNRLIERKSLVLI